MLSSAYRVGPSDYLNSIHYRDSLRIVVFYKIYGKGDDNFMKSKHKGNLTTTCSFAFSHDIYELKY